MARSVLLFDGVCNLCNGFVRFVIARDSADQFQFAPLQSKAARRLLQGVKEPLPDSIVLVDNGQLFIRSAAALRVARGLSFPWSLAYAFMAVPRPVRDWVYDIVASHRYHWFGRRDVCMVVTPELRSRFLND